MSLADFIQEHPKGIATGEAIPILKDIAVGLVSIEGKIVHRDLKPANVLLLDGHWHLTDFGISRDAEALTETYTRKGSFTYCYAAPEQWKNEHATGATDVYSFDVLAYELLSGNTPFIGPAPEDFKHQHVYEAAPKLDIASPRLSSLVEECLYKLPEARPKPANIMQRLIAAQEAPTSAAKIRLTAVNAKVSDEQTERMIQEAREQQEIQRKNELYKIAQLKFKSIREQLFKEITENAPLADIDRASRAIVNHYIGTRPHTIDLRSGRLTLSEPELSLNWNGPFEVIASASITVIQANPPQHEVKRELSLWFCDPIIEGEFQWYQTGFMLNPLIDTYSEVSEPFALRPSKAERAFSPAMADIQVEWPLELIDPDDPSKFIDEWINWFAEAAEGNLKEPNRMPENQDTNNYWWKQY